MFLCLYCTPGLYRPLKDVRDNALDTSKFFVVVVCSINFMSIQCMTIGSPRSATCKTK